MTLFKKDFATQIKASEKEKGVIEALVATYDKDSVGDKIVPGAFEKTLTDWKASGKNIPLIFAHKHDDANAYWGEITDAKETDEGLWVKAKFDMDFEPAARGFELVKSGKAGQFSFAYNVKDGEYVQEKNDADAVTDEYYALKELKLHEAGPCLIGANQNTRLLGAKRAEFVGEKASDVVDLTDMTPEQLQSPHDIMVETGVKCAHKCACTTKDNEEDTSGKTEDRETDKADDQRGNPKSVLSLIDIMELDS